MAIVSHTVRAVLFDLDGTLLDTATDLGHALNFVLSQHGQSPLPQSVIRPYAGRGCKGLLKLGFDIEENHPDYAALCHDLLTHYHSHLADTTQLFHGMLDVLVHLEEKRLPWGIVTNKPKRLTTKLVDALQLTRRAACIVSGDTVAHSKPHPAPILHACELIQIDPAHCIYVGDSDVDIIASKAAGTPAIVALYGYIPHDVNPSDWQADDYIHHPQDIITLLQ